MSDEQPTVLIVDDDISVRGALQNLFRSVGLRVKTFESAQEYISSEPPDAPGCLILDVRLPGLGGLELQQKLARRDIQIPIIFITAHGDVQMSVRAMKAGAVEFLTKPFRDQDLLAAVQQAIDRDRAARTERAHIAALRSRHDSLTVREKQVMELVVQGLLNKQIAGDLGITEPTVKLHRARLMHKMQAESLAELIRLSEKLAGTPRSQDL